MYKRSYCGRRISTACPSPTARALGLGPTTPPRSARAAEPLGFRWGGFAPPVSLLIPTFALVVAPRVGLPPPLLCPHNAPLPLKPKLQFCASVLNLAPVDCRCRRTKPVSCYALFQGWLLLSQPPGCLRLPTPLPTQFRLRDLSGRSGLLPS